MDIASRPCEAVNNHRSLFEDLPLDRTKRTLRLWKFKHVGALERPRLHLEVFYEDACPRYTALSYEWGDPSVNPRSVAINQSSLTITKNLWDFLMVLHSHHSCLDKWFWCDQISLDQQSTSERDHQVGLMGNIYMKAEEVFAWIGHLSDVPAFDLQGIDRFYIEKASFSCPLSSSRALTVLWMATQSYWTRLWIVQELRLAESIKVWCRTYSIEGSTFRTAVTRLSYCLDNEDLLIKDRRNTRTNRRVNSQIVGRARKLRATHSNTIMGLVPGSENRGFWVPLEGVLNIFCEHHCSDPRDKIFGLQAVVPEQERIDINYGLTPQNLLHRTVRSILIWQRYSLRLNGANKLGWYRPVNVYHACWSGHPGRGQRRSLKPELARFDKIAKSMQLPCRDVQAIYWAFLLPQIPHDLRYTWKSFDWFNFWAIWHEMHATAITGRQKGLAKELEEIVCASKYSSPEKLDQALYDATHQGYSKGQKAEVADRTQDMIERVGSAHGFVMYGEFLAHPEDWPFENEPPSRIFGTSDVAQKNRSDAGERGEIQE